MVKVVLANGLQSGWVDLIRRVQVMEGKQLALEELDRHVGSSFASVLLHTQSTYTQIKHLINSP